MSDFWFLSFANTALDGLIRSPIKRIRRQAEAMGVFGNHIRVWTENDLDEDFKARMKDRLRPGSRGYGYWCWKPQIVLQLLREMKEGDVLLYADAGCHLNPQGVPRLMDYFKLAGEHGIVTFQARTQDDPPFHFLADGDWCKGDLLDFFGARDDASMTRTGQLGGGIFLVCKSQMTQEFFHAFKTLMVDHFEQCDDSPSRSPNLPCFDENRHEQSVFSLLGKRRGVFSLSSLEYDPRNGGDDWSGMCRFPIWAKHDKGGVRSLFPVWFKNIVHRATGGRV